MTRYQYVTPTGKKIIGNCAVILARAGIDYFDENGEPEYSGDTEVFWDTQATDETEDAKEKYVDETGEEWTLDQCTLQQIDDDDDDDSVPTDK